jgi:hypothetical protein
MVSFAPFQEHQAHESVFREGDTTKQQGDSYMWGWSSWVRQDVTRNIPPVEILALEARRRRSVLVDGSDEARAESDE